MPNGNKFDLDSDFVRKLAKLLEETGLSEIEYAEGDKKIRCAISTGHVVQTVAAPVVEGRASGTLPADQAGVAAEAQPSAQAQLVKTQS